ncbi:metalloendopeptidase OMA1, mitochondrial-like [Saccostrea cucullata]|uniref:metalloendopeptidase OMA1, mitochondrial-like n=1 Tax=Saccostrea cuccullata TaxID=36930 RepID=UPI002ED5FAA4
MFRIIRAWHCISSQNICLQNGFRCNSSLTMARLRSMCFENRKSGFANKPITSFCIENNSNLMQTLSYGIILTQHRNFHLSHRLNIHPLVWVFGKPITKLSALIFGRKLRNHWKELHHKHKMIIAATLLGVTALALTLYTWAHTETVPITGRKRFIFITHDQLIKIVQREVEEVLQINEDRILPNTHELYKVVIKVAERLCVNNLDIQQMKDIQWKVFIVNDKTFNAVVYPTGEIFVNTGLFNAVINEDQLAAILGHEMAHALLSHAAEQLSYGQKWDFFVIVIMAAIWMIIPSDGIATITSWFMNRVIKYFDLPFSRELEKEADKVGLQLAAKACFDVREASVVWSLMQVKETVEGTSIPEFMSTHPSNETRVELIDFLIPRMTELREKCNCPRLSAKDPRVAMREVKQFVDDKVVAKQAGQNLSRVHLTRQKRVIKAQPA